MNKNLSAEIEQYLAKNEVFVAALCTNYAKQGAEWLVTSVEYYYGQKLVGTEVLDTFSSQPKAMDFIRQIGQPCMLVSTEDGWRKYYHLCR